MTPEMDARTKAVVAMAMSVLPHELGCDECAEFLAAYAEYRMAGGPLPGSLQLAGEHLDRCESCLEELNVLLAAMEDESAPSE